MCTLLRAQQPVGFGVILFMNGSEWTPVSTDNLPFLMPTKKGQGI